MKDVTCCVSLIAAKAILLMRLPFEQSAVVNATQNSAVKTKSLAGN
jgi:hypothetical protein